MKSSLVVGADIGGSHITAALVDLDTKTVLRQSIVRNPVNPKGSVERILNDWSKCIKQAILQSNAPVTKIGLAMPGPCNYEEGISYIRDTDKYDALYGLNLKVLLSQSLGVQETDVKMINDAACFLQGEVFSGAAAEANHAIGLTLGTGLGTSRFHGNLAEDASLWCMPFLESHAEEYISTRWFVKRYKELSGKDAKDVKALVDLYDQDECVKSIFQEFGKNLSSFLLQFISLDKPEVIVLGGNIANAYNLFKENIDLALAASDVKPVLKLSVLKEEAALIGAASLWLNANEKQTTPVTEKNVHA